MLDSWMMLDVVFQRGQWSNGSWIRCLMVSSTRDWTRQNPTEIWPFGQTQGDRLSHPRHLCILTTADGGRWLQMPWGWTFFESWALRVITHMANHDEMLLILINDEQKKHDQPQCYENHVLKRIPLWLTFASCHGWWLRRFLTWCLAPFGTREALALSLPCPFVESIQPRDPLCLPCICFTSSIHENKTILTMLISLISRQYETHTTSQDKGIHWSHLLW